MQLRDDTAIGMQYKLENGTGTNTNTNAKYSVNGREHFKQGAFKLSALDVLTLLDLR
ncbi:MAG: hypothetical protein OFPII_19660 [Osedax symbiont Rs1]|nr:MAG: hypothetical protein OFPII_19660 [Osedax symbiont Rs1]